MKTNAVIENILERRSIRAFEERPVAREDLEAIVTCGQWAPSAMNRQEWTFVVLSDAEKTAHLASVMATALGREDYDMYRPAAAILVAHKKGAAFGREDDGCALQTMFLVGICDEPAVRAELTALGVPEDAEVHGICALGYATADGIAHERTSQVVWA